MLDKIELGQDSFDYVRTELGGGDTYARSLLRIINMWKMYTFLPEEFKDRPIDFQKSISLTTGIRIYDETRNLISQFVASFLGGENKISIFETLSNPESIKRKPFPPSVIYHTNEIYFLLQSHEKLDRVKRAFKGARRYPFVCGLIDLYDTGFVVVDYQEIQLSQWGFLASKTQYLIVGAYDSEGFLICENSIKPQVK
jgi:hypothetical protein